MLRFLTGGSSSKNSSSSSRAEGVSDGPADMPRLPSPFLRNPPHKIEVRKRDFHSGNPLVIRQPDTLVVIMENIEFNFGFPEQGTVSPFHLGHFGGILIGAPRVKIDLNGKRLMQNPNFRRRQRFFSLIELDVTPFPNKGPPREMGFTTQPLSPSDITIVGPGTLGESSHFCVHGAVAGNRILIDGVRMEGFEVSAISISDATDVMVRNCEFGRPARPSTSSEVAMLRDLARECGRKNMHETANALERMCGHPSVKAPFHTDAICRTIVIAPEMNVGLPNLNGGGRRTERVCVASCTFEDVRAEPKEVVGVSVTRGGEPLRDAFGNLVQWKDAMGGTLVSRTQAALTPGMRMREALVRGKPPPRLHPVHGFDLRGHALTKKASAFVRIDGADHVTLYDLKGGVVSSVGPASSSVGYMLNACRKVRVKKVSMRGVTVSDPCVNSLSDDRPQSGFYVRQCYDTRIEEAKYSDESACACVLRHSKGNALIDCAFNAPFTALKSNPLTYKSAGNL